MRQPTRFVIVWAAGFVVLAVLDFIWIGIVAAPLYQAELGPLLADMTDAGPTRVIAALTVWLLITFAIMVFVLPLARGRITAAVGRGALMGFIMYGVYDLTNYAVLRGWTLPATALDMAWGTVICATLAVVMSTIDRRLRRDVPDPG